MLILSLISCDCFELVVSQSTTDGKTITNCRTQGRRSIFNQELAAFFSVPMLIVNVDVLEYDRNHLYYSL